MTHQFKPAARQPRVRAFPVVVVGVLGAGGGLATALQTHEHDDVDFAFPETTGSTAHLCLCVSSRLWTLLGARDVGTAVESITSPRYGEVASVTALSYTPAHGIHTNCRPTALHMSHQEEFDGKLL